jgi:mono/diheme cytochrome c family protein
MTDIVTRISSTSGRWHWIAGLLKEAIRRAIVAHQTRRVLDDLPDGLLRDVGLHRSEIDFIANSIASETADPTRDPQDQLNRSVARLRAARRRVDSLVPQAALRIFAVLAIAGSVLAGFCDTGRAQTAQVKRGEYLVTLGGCNDCHTPGYFFGKPDKSRLLGGSEVGFAIPDLGVFHGPNLTPDSETGLGNWSADEIVAAITKGQRPDGRILAPIMPWHAFANLTRQDAYAIAAFLKSLPPVRNKVPGPFGPNEKPTSFVMKVVPPQAATEGDAAPK